MYLHLCRLDHRITDKQRQEISDYVKQNSEQFEFVNQGNYFVAKRKPLKKLMEEMGL